MTPLERVAATAVAGVGIATATTSFHALTGLHAAAGAPGWLAPMLPVAFDGMVTAACLAVVAARRAGRPAGYSWFLVGLYTTLSIAGNAVYAAVPRPGSGGPLAAGIAAVFPLTLFLSFEQFLRIIAITRSMGSEHTAAQPAPVEDDSPGAAVGAEPAPGRADASPERADWRAASEAAPALAARNGRDAVAALLVRERAAGRDLATLTGPAVAAATGLSVRRSQELLARLRADVPSGSVGIDADAEAAR